MRGHIFLFGTANFWNIIFLSLNFRDVSWPSLNNLLLLFYLARALALATSIAAFTEVSAKTALFLLSDTP
jgi:hypothetical protein